jgi:tyrosyl-tRNA synthetase
MENNMENLEDEVMNKVNKLLSLAEECDTKERLIELIQKGESFTAYNGFEPSGRMHIAQGLMTVMNANDIISCGGQIIIYIADWFAQMNHKMGGDLDKIKEVGCYFIEVFKSCGIDMSKTKFIWASDLMNESKTYLPRVLDISTNFTLNRITKCCQIMGRNEKDSLHASQIFYPCMQAADIFELTPGGVDICQLGLDQRKVNMLAIEYANKKGLKPPIILSHHMLMSLKGPDFKMAKSVPGSAIFMDDSEEDVKRLINSAYCTDSITSNPIYEYIKYLIFRWFVINKNESIMLCGKYYNYINDIDADFATMNKKELKADVSNYINKILHPIRNHFTQPEMKMLADRVASYRITK